MTNDKIKEPTCPCEEVELSEKDSAPSNEEKIKALLAKTDVMIAKCKTRKKKKLTA